MSITQAACSVIRRAACICAAESAIQFWTVCFSASIAAVRARGSVARSQSMSKARRETPSQRMQWWMRPGYEPLLGDEEALALAAEQRLRPGTRTSS